MRSMATFAWRQSGLKSAWKNYKFDRLLGEWRQIRDDKSNPPASSKPRILIIPPDPLLLTASRGDQAMLGAVNAFYSEKFPDAEYVVATTGDEADRRAAEINAIPCRILDGTMLQDIEKLQGHGITHCVLVGADVLDGSYDPVFSARLLMTADLLARRGVSCKVTGFSFSKKPYPGLQTFFNESHPSIVYNLRDPASYERFQKSNNAASKLVADIAFLIKPTIETPNVQEIQNWVDAQRALDRKVVGINIHPLVLDLNDRHNIDSVVNNFATALSNIMKKRSLSLLFIEHDFRGTSADEHCLRPLYKFLEKDFKSHIHFPTAKLSAQELKGVSGLLDVVISGRMHLMIAALGAGTPVFGINYKDKMEGLLSYLEFGASSFCTAQSLLNDIQSCEMKIADFIENSESHRVKVKQHLGKVKEMSRSNFY